MNKIIIFLASTGLFLIGFLFFLHQESWIIINLPSKPTQQALTKSSITSKEVTLWIWNKGSFNKETTDIIFSDDTTQTLTLLLNQWFALLEEEKITDQQITVQSVTLSANGQEAFVSLHQYPFNKQNSTHDKLMIMQSLLKTIKQAQLNIHHIRLLVHHQPIQDDHLNFNISWPILGYLA